MRKNTYVWANLDEVIMKYCLLFILMGIQVKIYAQWTDDFSSSFLFNWNGDTAQFKINSSKQLQLNSSNSGNSFIYRSFSFDKSLVWKFYFQMKFAPSANNKLRIYLSMDKPDKQSFEGYFFEIGENGTNDNWKFFVQKNAASILLGQGTLSKLAVDPSMASFYCTLKNDSTWSFYVDYNGGNNFTELSEVKDSIRFRSINSFFALECEYTSTRTDKFFFDDISIQVPTIDTLGPNIVMINNISEKELYITFDEPVDTNTSKNILNYTILNFENPINSKVVDDMHVLLMFKNEMLFNQVYELNYLNIKDLNNNSSGAKSYQFITKFSKSPKPGEIVINEFICDPEPTIALPKAEFIELYNIGNTIINLVDCKISDGTGISSSFPNYLINPDSYVILCANKDTLDFKKFGNTIGLSSMPTLNNDGDQIILYDKNKEVLDQVTYNIGWYKDKNKEEGGYSIELAFPNRRCQLGNAWMASNDPSGGTPGQKNSIVDSSRDLRMPEIVSLIPISEYEIKLVFNKVLDRDFMTKLGNYAITPNISLASAELIDPDLNVIILLLNGPLEKGIQYELIIVSILDCSSNEHLNVRLDFELPSEASSGEILFNELLFNPASNAEDYIELYNTSDKLITTDNLYLRNKLKDLKWTKVNAEIQIPKKSYIVLTKNIRSIIDQFPSNDSLRIYESVIPPMDDVSGSLELAIFQNHEFVIIDSVHYNDEWHNKLLSNHSGVSLEKIEPDWTSDNSFHWTSATINSGYGTPGLKNSQLIDTLKLMDDDLFTVEPKILSPNGDGHKDFLRIQIHLDKPGYKSDIKIYSMSGELIKQLYQSIVSANEILTWQGEDEENQIVSSGNYILYGVFIHPQGEVKSQKLHIIVDSGK